MHISIFFPNNFTNIIALKYWNIYLLIHTLQSIIKFTLQSTSVKVCGCLILTTIVSTQGRSYSGDITSAVINSYKKLKLILRFIFCNSFPPLVHTMGYCCRFKININWSTQFNKIDIYTEIKVHHFQPSFTHLVTAEKFIPYVKPCHKQQHVKGNWNDKVNKGPTSFEPIMAPINKWLSILQCN